MIICAIRLKTTRPRGVIGNSVPSRRLTGWPAYLKAWDGYYFQVNRMVRAVESVIPSLQHVERACRGLGRSMDELKKAGEYSIKLSEGLTKRV